MGLRTDWEKFKSHIPSAPEEASENAKYGINHIMHLMMASYYHGVISGIESSQKLNGLSSVDDVIESVDDLKWLEETQKFIQGLRVEH